MSIKNPTLRRRTKELTECANDAGECQLLGYELKELGSLVTSMAIHMGDLQRKIDSQAEHIKALNEKLTNSEKSNNCETCKHYLFTDIDGYYCEHETYGQPCQYAPKNEPQTSGVVWTEDAIKNEPKSYSTWASTDEPQTERSE